ncbi:MAG TPA: alpha-mannosidase [Candidatus Dormibacteraeota bacterium]|nr:alpha-mannosidase [Candidatus Dormibacteraeota bacterium]
MNRILALFLAFFCAFACAAQTKETADPYKPILDRLESLTILTQPEWRYHDDLAHPEDVTLNDADWSILKIRDRWKTGPRVLRRWIEIPEKINGYSTLGARVRLEIYFGSEDHMMISVFSNGSLVARGDEDMQQPIPLTESAKPGQKFLIAVRVNAGQVDTGLFESRIRIEPQASHIDPGFLRAEILAARPMLAAFPDGKTEHESQLDATLKAIDFAKLDAGDQAAFEHSLEQAQAKLKVLDPWLKRFTIRAAGNSHIDMAWLWPWTETVEVVRNTFRSVLDLMREYPDLTFSMGSAQTFEWMEEKYPDLFKEIQQRVREGRWEIVGGMWVEPDLNMPGGESLVRQILIGKRYFQSKFGVDVKIGWNPDSFGYSWQLPQIYKKSGIDYFVTQKLYWNDTTKFPYKLFWWEAPDGSRLLTYIPHDYANDTNPVKMASDLAAYAPAMYSTEPAAGREMMHLFGVGDHGGGPTRDMLDVAKRWMAPDAVYPKLQFGTATGFFNDLQNSSNNLNIPTMRDELYFEYHRGVLTTQAETKRRVRKTEELLLDTEKFTAFSSLSGTKYPSNELNAAWKGLLFDDFHDILPGSGIAVNYLDAKRNLEAVDNAGGKILHRSLREIAARINTKSSGTPVVIFNSLSWPRTEVVEIEAQLPSPARYVEVNDTTGKAIPSQLLHVDDATQRVRLLVQATVPSLGYATLYVHPAAKAYAGASNLRSSSDSLENEFVRLKIDPASGCLTSLVDKHTGIETLAPAETDSGGPKSFACGNLLQAFKDKPKDWDAWNIDADFEKERTDLLHPESVQLVSNESGPLRAVLRVKHHFQNSEFTQDITITAGNPRVDVKTIADWHEKHILLKVAFPLSVHNDKATFEIPFGSIERPTTRNTPAEQAKFEVPALHWGDLSDAKHGFSLLNDSKYGYDAKGNVLRLSLLRSPEWPDPHADEGVHEFTYSLYAHSGTWRDALTVRRGYELNYPLESMQIANHQGPLQGSHSFLSSNSDNVVITAVKNAEDGGALIIRFYEWAGKNSDVSLTLPSHVESAEETDLMERPLGTLKSGADSVTVPVKPYEIKTLKITFAP